MTVTTSSFLDEDSVTDTMTSPARSLTDSAAVPINEPAIRMWELNENSTHYDRMVAAPSDEDLIKFWSGWAGIMLITGVLTTLILIPLLSCRRPKVRKNPFNVYLIFLMVPDMMVAWICGFTCLTNALAGHFTTPFMCRFQSFYMIASIGANSWLNLLITRQLYKMLDAARKFQRFPMPTKRQVIKEAICVYIYSLFLATLGVIPSASWWPHKTRLTIGAACIPMDYDYASTAFFYGVFFPLLFGIPLLYVCWAAYQIYKHKMLPPSGRRRILAVYFFRLAAVFVIMWLPGLLLLFVLSAWVNPWVQWAGGAWSHMQGLVSALLSLLKPDIRKAVFDFWFCVPDLSLLFADEEGGNPRQNSSIVTKKPWANSSVYWSPQIGLNSNNKKGRGAQSNQSRISSYQEADDDLEARAAQLQGTLETTASNVLASDDSVSLELNAMELEMDDSEIDELVTRDVITDLPPNLDEALPHFDKLPPIAEGSRAVSTGSRVSTITPSVAPSLAQSVGSKTKHEDPDAPVGNIYIVKKE